MEWLNYHHLLYFWVVAREGGLTQAGKVLHVTHPTLSAQLRALEESLGEQLFTRSGRKLVLTDMGRVVYGYAEEIFSLGRELVDTVKDRAGGRSVRFNVGIANAVPKLIVRQLLEPALKLSLPVRLVCREDSYDKLLAELSMHTLDVVIADAPVPPGSSVRAFNHLLGECGVGIFGTPSLARARRKNFPRSLDGAPVLLPLEQLPLRRAIDQWLSKSAIRPQVLGEFEDSALLKVFGADGIGLFPAPMAVAAQVRAQYGVELVGEIPDVSERYYAISVERRLKHPAVVALLETARRELFPPS